MRVLKLCLSCKILKPIEDFSRSPQTKDGKQCYCRPCMVVRTREYRKKYPNVVKESRKRAWQRWKIKNPDSYEERIIYYICKRYNISREYYTDLFIKQNGLCKICKSTDHKRLSIDHCHKTNKIRGLLCTNCNQGLGNFKDSTDLLQEAINYLNN